jgi:hypothetical protein
MYGCENVYLKKPEFFLVLLNFFQKFADNPFWGLAKVVISSATKTCGTEIIKTRVVDPD